MNQINDEARQSSPASPAIPIRTETQTLKAPTGPHCFPHRFSHPIFKSHLRDMYTDLKNSPFLRKMRSNANTWINSINILMECTKIMPKIFENHQFYV